MAIARWMSTASRRSKTPANGDSAGRDLTGQVGSGGRFELAAGGIQTALLTTCFGLIVGSVARIEDEDERERLRNMVEAVFSDVLMRLLFDLLQA